MAAKEKKEENVREKNDYDPELGDKSTYIYSTRSTCI